MNKLVILSTLWVFGSGALADDGRHPGLAPQSTSVYESTLSWPTSINTKYGTTNTADEIKAATQQRRADSKMMNEGSPHSGQGDSSGTSTESY